MAFAGRHPERNRRRDATSGRSRGETPAEATAVARAQRIRGGAAADDALNALHGSTIGVLHRRWQMDKRDPGGISADQYNAAQAYIAAVGRNAAVMGIPPPHPKAIGEIGEHGASCRPEPDERVVREIRRRFADFRRALLDCGAELGLGARVNAAVYRVCIEDWPVGAVTRHDVENLRAGLNAIHRLLRRAR
jgi:hypothetical protein